MANILSGILAKGKEILGRWLGKDAQEPDPDALAPEEPEVEEPTGELAEPLENVTLPKREEAQQDYLEGLEQRDSQKSDLPIPEMPSASESIHGQVEQLQTPEPPQVPEAPKAAESIAAQAEQIQSPAAPEMPDVAESVHGMAQQELSPAIPEPQQSQVELPEAQESGDGYLPDFVSPESPAPEAPIHPRERGQQRTREKQERWHAAKGRTPASPSRAPEPEEPADDATDDALPGDDLPARDEDQEALGDPLDAALGRKRARRERNSQRMSRRRPGGQQQEMPEADEGELAGADPQSVGGGAPETEGGRGGEEGQQANESMRELADVGKELSQMGEQLITKMDELGNQLASMEGSSSGSTYGA